jgi:hypothetical protein
MIWLALIAVIWLAIVAATLVLLTGSKRADEEIERALRWRRLHDQEDDAA